MQVNAEQSVELEVSQYPQIRESDFHNRFQSATIEGDKPDFNLMLAMLTQDAQQFDQFNLPKSPPLKDISELQKKFFVQPAKVYGKVSSEKILQQNNWAHLNEMASIQLDLALKPEPLVSEQFDLPSDVFDNLDFNARNKLLNESNVSNDTEVVINDNIKQLSEYRQIDVEGWFNVLQQARTLSALA